MESEKSPLIIANGDLPEPTVLSRIWERTGIKICCDGALDRLRKMDKQPDIVIGDLDSINNKHLLPPHIKLIRLGDQNTTDSEKAFEYCLTNAYKTAIVLGALGKRMDHTLYNLVLSGKFYQKGLKLIIVHENETIFPASGVLELNKPKGTRISFVPLFGTVGPIISTGLKYSLAGRKLSPTGFCAISNEFLENSAKIEIEKGLILVIMEGEPDWS